MNKMPPYFCTSLW